MSFLSNLLGSKEQAPLAKMRKDALRRAEPISILGKAIFESAIACAEAIRPHIDFPSDQERQRQWVFVVHEFVYFFMHMTNRAAFHILGHESRIRLQEELGAAVPTAVTEAICGHWPAELKAKLVREFCQNLDAAELEYGDCKELLSRNLAEDAILTRLAFSVSEHAGRGKDIATVTTIITSTLNAYQAMRLDELVTNTRSSLS